MEKLTKEEKEFINGYYALVQKTGLYWNGCGCCGSPWLTGLEPSKYITAGLENSYLQEFINGLCAVTGGE